MRIYIKFILPLITLLFTSNLIGQTIVEGSEEFKNLTRKNDIIEFSGKPFCGTIITYNDQNKHIRNYKDGKNCCLYEGYYENGQLKKEGNYKDGIKEGLQN